jgi:hypothetical protein
MAAANPPPNLRLAQLLDNAVRTDFVVEAGRPLALGLTLDSVPVICLLSVRNHTLEVNVYRRSEGLDPFEQPWQIPVRVKPISYPENW